MKFNDLIAEINDDSQIDSQTTKTQNDNQGGLIDKDDSTEVQTNPTRYNLRSRKAGVTDPEKMAKIMQDKIPREIRNLTTSYNKAEDAFRMSINQVNFTTLEYGMAFFATEDKINDLIEPNNFDAAWNHPNKNQRMKRREAIKKDFGDMMKYKVWKKISRDEVAKERRTIGSKWVFKIKRDGRFRARLCGLGYTQITGVDFTENHAPVVNDVTFRILIILKIINGWDTELFDVETAFFKRYIRRIDIYESTKRSRGSEPI